MNVGRLVEYRIVPASPAPDLAGLNTAGPISTNASNWPLRTRSDKHRGVRGPRPPDLSNHGRNDSSTNLPPVWRPEPSKISCSLCPHRVRDRAVK